MAYSQRRLSDPTDLRAVAHPVRLAIIEQLTVHGAMTASRLADRIDESPSNCSWHLRKLAEHGFVEEAEGGTGRQRPWRITHMGMSWDDFGDSEEQMLAGEALSQVLLQRSMDRLATSRARQRGDDPAWRDAAEVNQSALWLTAEELKEINDQVQALFLAKIDRHEDPSLRPPGSRLCALVQWGMPTYDIADPTPQDES